MIPYTKSLYFIYFIFKNKKEKIGLHLKKTGKLVFGTSKGQVFEGISKNRRQSNYPISLMNYFHLQKKKE